MFNKLNIYDCGERCSKKSRVGFFLSICVLLLSEVVSIILNTTCIFAWGLISPGDITPQEIISVIDYNQSLVKNISVKYQITERLSEEYATFKKTDRERTLDLIEKGLVKSDKPADVLKKIILETPFENAYTNQTQYTFISEGEKKYITKNVLMTTSEFKEPEKVIAFDGQMYRVYEPENKKGQVSNEGFFPFHVEPMSWLSVKGQTLIKWLKSGQTTVLPTTERIDDKETYVIETIFSVKLHPALHAVEYAKLKIKTWVDPTRGMMPVRIEGSDITKYRNIEKPFESPAKEIIYPIKVAQNNGVWHVTWLKYTSHVADYKYDEYGIQYGLRDGKIPVPTRIFVAREKEIIVSELKINEGVPSNIFTIEFPVGTVIYNGIVDETLIMGGAGPRVEEIVEDILKSSEK